MKRCLLLLAAVSILVCLSFSMVPSSAALTGEEKQFMKEHGKEMTLFMDKCSGCHNLKRVLEKRKSKEEWDKILKIMSGKPHANISDDELQEIGKWIGFLNSTIMPGP